MKITKLIILLALIGFAGCSQRQIDYRCVADCNQTKLECTVKALHLDTEIR